MWLRGSDEFEAEAAAVVFAETLLNVRAYIEAQKKR